MDDKRYCIECGTPMDEVPLKECATHAAANEAPPPDHILDLHQRVAAIIRRKYLRYTTNQMLAHETGIEVLEEVTRTYESIAAGAAAEEASIS